MQHTCCTPEEDTVRACNKLLCAEQSRNDVFATQETKDPFPNPRNSEYMRSQTAST